MATNWTTQDKASSTDNWDVRDVGNVSIGPRWEDMDTASTDYWEDLTGHYWEWTKTWKFSGKATARDTD